MSEKGRMETIRELILQAVFRPKADTDKNSQRYWNTRWRLNLQHDRLTNDIRSRIRSEVEQSMVRHGCKNVLEVGCGKIVPLRELSNATHLDFSLKALKHSKLDSFIYADITNRIPVPDKTFDATFSSSCLIHIPNESIKQACVEISRVTKKVIILNEGNQRDLAQYFDGLICEQPFKDEVNQMSEENKSCNSCKHHDSWVVDEEGVVWGSDVECETCHRFQIGMGDNYEPKEKVKCDG